MDWRTSVSTIPGGNAGNLRTLHAMSGLAQAASVDPVVIQAAQDAIRPYPERNPDADFAAILGDVRRRMRYTHDPLGAEVVKDPAYVIAKTNRSQFGEPMDCDDASTLAGAMLGAIGYQTKFVTVAVDRARPDEWSHVYLAARHPAGHWVALDPIVREFDAGDEVPAGQLTAPRAYHEGVDPMIRGVGCESGTTGVGSHPAGLGYCSRGFGDADWSNVPGGNPATPGTANYAIARGVASPAAAADVPWYQQVLSAATGIFTTKSNADIAASNARIAAANARIAAARGGPVASQGLFKNADGSTNMTNVVIAAGVVGLVGIAIFKATRRGRR